MIGEIRNALKREKAQALFICSKPNKTWLVPDVGDMDNIYIIVTAKEVHGFADSRDILTLKKYNYIESHIINEYADVIKFFKTLKISKLLIEGDLTLMDFDSYIKPLNVLTKTINMREVRSVKTESEIAIMQESANIACDCIAYVKKNIKVGMTEEQVAQMTKIFMISAGASELSFSSIVSFGENSADIHHMPSATRKLKTSEIIMLDIGCIYKGYCSDITRCFWLGKPKAWMVEMYNLVLNAQVSAVKAAKDGVKAKDLDAICRNYFKKHKPEWADTFQHGTGHGVGIQIHELPSIRTTSNYAVKSGNVHTIEPGVYVEGLGGVRIEDTIVITKTGNIVLTKKASKKLSVLI